MQTDTLSGRLATIRDSGSVRQLRIVAVDKNGWAYTQFGDEKVEAILAHRLELVPQATDDSMPGMMTMDGFRTTRDEATDWLAFVLLQAGMLFMNAPPGPETRAEVLRIMTARGEREDGPVVQAALAYIDRADEIHETMRQQFGD